MTNTYRLANYVDTVKTENGLIFGFGSIRRFITNEKKELQEAILYLSSILKDQGLTRLEIKDIFNSNLSVDDDLFEEAFNFLIDGHYLIIQEHILEGSRYNRNHLYYNLYHENPSEIQSNLESKHVIILGTGGIGNLISLGLVTSGVGKITLVDDDLIEESNLTRQILFTEKDVGKNKIIILADELKKRNSNCTVETIKQSIKNQDDLFLLPKCDLIVLSADTPSDIIYWVNDYAVKTNTPFINIGYVLDIAVWGPLVIPGKTGCIKCNKKIYATQTNDNAVNESYIKNINKKFQAPSNLPINMIASGHALCDILKFLGGFSSPAALNKRIGVWTHNLKIEEQDCSINDLCTCTVFNSH